MTDFETDPYTIRFRRCADELQQQGVAALAELYDLAAPRLARYAVTLTRNLDDAEDALQAAFVQIARCPQRLAEARHPWPYLLRVVRNEALRVVRQRCRNKAPLPDADLADRWGIPNPGDLATQSERQEIAESVNSALNKLPPMQAEVVVLKIWENMTFAQIGAVLGTSPNTAASRYRYALEKLTPLLQPHDAEVLHVS
ncbi:MAG: RNA polymerase sigma factor [Planctomycetaceae bacterium]